MSAELKIEVSRGPYNTWGCTIVKDGVVLAYTYSSKAHVGAWKAGAEARWKGHAEKSNPYRGDVMGSNGRIALGRRGFRNAWSQGYAGMHQAIRTLEVGDG